MKQAYAVCDPGSQLPGDDVTEEDIVPLHAVLKEAKQVSRNEGSYC